jgi:hypothetical protein
VAPRQPTGVCNRIRIPADSAGQLLNCPRLAPSGAGDLRNYTWLADHNRLPLALGKKHGGSSAVVDFPDAVSCVHCRPALGTRRKSLRVSRSGWKARHRPWLGDRFGTAACIDDGDRDTYRGVSFSAGCAACVGRVCLEQSVRPPARNRRAGALRHAPACPITTV